MKGNKIVERVKKEMIEIDLENEVDKVIMKFREDNLELIKEYGEEKFREKITELFVKFISEEDE